MPPNDRSIALLRITIKRRSETLFDRRTWGEVLIGRQRQGEPDPFGITDDDPPKEVSPHPEATHGVPTSGSIPQMGSFIGATAGLLRSKFKTSWRKAMSLAVVVSSYSG